jgi:hypothetical protein
MPNSDAANTSSATESTPVAFRAKPADRSGSNAVDTDTRLARIPVAVAGHPRADAFRSD